MQRIALLHAVVDKRTEQVVRRSYSVHIACKMEIYVLHRDYLCVSAACCAALDTENRSERRLSQGENGVFADNVHRFMQTYRNSGLALTCGSGVDSCDEYQLAIRLILSLLIKTLGEFSLIVTVWLILLLGNTQFLCDLGDLQHFSLLGYLNI